MATVHMIAGPVGAGKTTYAQRLAREAAAVHFSIDDWMATLFAADAPARPDLTWALERTARCEAQVWKTAGQVLALGRDVVLDLGFLRCEQRERFRQAAAEAGQALRLHLVTAAAERRRDRVRERNRQRGETFRLEVSDAMFEWSEGWFEPPDEDELRDARVVHTD
jgi:predicted kinase